MSLTEYLDWKKTDTSETITSSVKNTFDYDAFKVSQLGGKLIDIWETKHLKSTQLTTVGQIIGVMVSDQYVGGKTNMSSWNQWCF